MVLTKQDQVRACKCYDTLRELLSIFELIQSILIIYTHRKMFFWHYFYVGLNYK